MRGYSGPDIEIPKLYGLNAKLTLIQIATNEIRVFLARSPILPAEMRDTNRPNRRTLGIRRSIDQGSGVFARRAAAILPDIGKRPPTCRSAAPFLTYDEREQDCDAPMKNVRFRQNWSDTRTVHQWLEIFIGWPGFPIIAAYSDCGEHGNRDIYIDGVEPNEWRRCLSVYRTMCMEIN